MSNKHRSREEIIMSGITRFYPVELAWDTRRLLEVEYIE